MFRYPYVFVLLHIFLTTACSEKLVVDLSHELKPNITTFPGAPSLQFTILQRGVVGNTSRWLESNKYQTMEHYGTHVDVPAHMGDGKWRLHQVPLQTFMGPAVVIDIAERAKANRDAQVLVSDLQSWEKKYGKIPDGAIVLMRSGWSKKFSDSQDYLGPETVDNRTVFHWPGFHVDAVSWLIQNRPNFNGIGVDTLSLDNGPTQNFPTHTTLFSEKKIGYENLANLDALPEADAMFYGTPVNLYDGSGFQVRAFGVIDTDGGGCSSLVLTRYLVFLIVILCYYII